MKFSVDLGHWTTTKAALAVAGALVAGAVGSAVAFSPIIAPPVKWQGGAEFSTTTMGTSHLMTVPAGKNFLLTDVVASNIEGVTARLAILSNPGGTCTAGSFTTRLNTTMVPPQESTVLALQTGIGFTPGQAVCVSATFATLVLSVRGFYFTAAAPPS